MGKQRRFDTGFYGISLTIAKLLTIWLSTKVYILQNHKISFWWTHNLEVLGSSPSWSTLKIKHLQRFCRCFFFSWWTWGEHRTLDVTYIYFLKPDVTLWEFKKVFSPLSMYSFLMHFVFSASLFNSYWWPSGDLETYTWRTVCACLYHTTRSRSSVANCDGGFL